MRINFTVSEKRPLIIEDLNMGCYVVINPTITDEELSNYLLKHELPVIRKKVGYMQPVPKAHYHQCVKSRFHKSGIDSLTTRIPEFFWHMNIQNLMDYAVGLPTSYLLRVPENYTHEDQF